MGKLTIRNMLGRLLPKRGSKKEQVGAHSRRDWGVILIIFTFVNLVVIGFSIYLFLQINRGDIFFVETEETQTTESFDQSQLDSVLLFYEKRKQEFERMKTDISSIPSVR